MKTIKKIVTIGPESTGKSSLCAALATHFNSIWVREYAREYLLEHGTDYTHEDLLTIAKGQLANEEAGLQAAAALAGDRIPLFLDTDMIVMKVWDEYVFGKCHRWILDRIAERPYDLYLLCKPDLPWVKDELREYPDPETRIKLYHHYKDILVNQSVPWIEISGDYAERTQKAVRAVEGLLG